VPWRLVNSQHVMMPLTTRYNHWLSDDQSGLNLNLQWEEDWLSTWQRATPPMDTAESLWTVQDPCHANLHRCNFITDLEPHSQLLFEYRLNSGCLQRLHWADEGAVNWLWLKYFALQNLSLKIAQSFVANVRIHSETSVTPCQHLSFYCTRRLMLRNMASYILRLS